MNSDTALAIDPFPQRFVNTILSVLRDKRMLLAIILLGTVAVIFWSTSRVPQLNEKAMMGGEANISTISFDVVLPVLAEDPVWRQIAHGTVNWIQTNKKGMTFGVIFGACMMVLLSLMRRRSFESGFANSFLGMVVGAPLGVCVNCAAPIAHGLHSAGARAETTLARDGQLAQFEHHRGHDAVRALPPLLGGFEAGCHIRLRAHFHPDPRSDHGS